jgi:hypothetical protein
MVCDCCCLHQTLISLFHYKFDDIRSYCEPNNLPGLQGLSKLKHLNLRNNYFIGSILGSVSKLVSLEVINLSRNNMSGSLQNTGTETNSPLQLVQLIFFTCFKTSIHAWQVWEIFGSCENCVWDRDRIYGAGAHRAPAS